MLVHVVNHGTQHRAEAAALLTAGGRPGELDLIFYAEERALPWEPTRSIRSWRYPDPKGASSSRTDGSSSTGRAATLRAGDHLPSGHPGDAGVGTLGSRRGRRRRGAVGVGESSRLRRLDDAHRAPSLLAVGRDTAALAAHLGLDGYAVFGSSGGGPFAVATAVADPGARACPGCGGWHRAVAPARPAVGQPRGSRVPRPAGCGRRRRRVGGMHRSAEDELGGLAARRRCRRDVPVRRRERVDPRRAISRDLGRQHARGVGEPRWLHVRQPRVGRRWDVDPRDVIAPSLLWYGALDGTARRPTGSGTPTGSRTHG